MARLEWSITVVKCAVQGLNLGHNILARMVLSDIHLIVNVIMRTIFRSRLFLIIDFLLLFSI